MRLTWHEFCESGFGLLIALMIVGGIALLCKFAVEANKLGSWAYNVTMALREALG